MDKGDVISLKMEKSDIFPIRRKKKKKEQVRSSLMLQESFQGRKEKNTGIKVIKKFTSH